MATQGNMTRTTVFFTIFSARGSHLQICRPILSHLKSKINLKKWLCRYAGDLYKTPRAGSCQKDISKKPHRPQIG